MGEISGFTAAWMKMSSGMLSLVVWNKLTDILWVPSSGLW
jgi:hypothetical protein